MRHTPGPWTIKTYHDCTFKIIRDLEPNVEPANRLKYDARLIECAPDMLAELMKLTLAQQFGDISLPQDFVEAINSLIKRAEGRTLEQD